MQKGVQIASTSGITRDAMNREMDGPHAPSSPDTGTKFYAPPKKNKKDRTKGLIIKVQLPYSPLMNDTTSLEASQIVGDCMVYNERRDFMCTITRSTGPAAFDALVALIQQRGVGGLKGYFRAELPAPDQLIIRTSDLLAAQPF